MKKINYLYMLCIALILVCYSCNKKSNPAPSVSNISLKFNGTSYRTSVVRVIASTNVIELTGIFNSQSLVVLTIVNPKVGSFNVPGGDATFHMITDTSAQHLYWGVGTMVISSLSTTVISGTFDMSCMNVSGENANVTDGSFQVNLD